MVREIPGMVRIEGTGRENIKSDLLRRPAETGRECRPLTTRVQRRSLSGRGLWLERYEGLVGEKGKVEFKSRTFVADLSQQARKPTSKLLKYNDDLFRERSCDFRERTELEKVVSGSRKVGRDSTGE